MERSATLQLNDTILHKASLYAESKGVDLSAIVESFLLNLISVDNNSRIKTFPISDKVRSLAGHMKKNSTPVDSEKEKEEYFKEKYGL